MAPLNGIAPIDLGGKQCFVVCFNGRLQPTVFASWLEAREHLVVLLYTVIEGEPA